MHYKYLLLFIIPVLLLSCKKEGGPYTQSPLPVDPPDTIATPAPVVLLKDIVIPHLPSPFYHFEYDTTGKPIFASYASGLTMYDFIYSGNRLGEMRNNIFVNKDTLRYTYDNEGRVTVLRYINEAGVVYTRILFTYDGQKLIKLERGRRSGNDFITDKTMTFQYHADGNLLQTIDHRLAFNGQPELNFVNRYEQYDNKINVDGFSIIHNEFFDHLVFLPGITLQKNNPRKLMHTGDDVNYQIEYAYTYNNKNEPLAKDGVGVWSSGPRAGEQFASNSVFSYYP